MSIFVMGATGRVGGAVLRELRGKYPVRAAGRGPNDAGVVWVPFLLEDSQTFHEALDGVTAVFLMRPPQITKKSAFSPFLAALESQGIKRLVALSVMGAETNRLLPHYRMEQAIKEGRFEWTIVRPSDFMQNLETVHRTSIRDRHEIAVPAGRGRSAFVDVDDLGVAIARLLVEDGHVGRGYTFTGSEALSFKTVANTLSSELHRVIRYRPVGVARFVLEQINSGAPLGMSLVMSVLYTLQRLGLADRTTDDLPRFLGRPPGTLTEYVSRNTSIWLDPTIESRGKFHS